MKKPEAELWEAKKELRRRMLAARRALSESERASCSRQIAVRLLSLPEVRDAHCVFAYAAMPDEVRTEELLTQLLSEGRRVAIPLVTGERKMEAVELTSTEALERGAYGILTVKEGAGRILPPKEIDCALVPGVAFSPKGDRLGMGGGFYDAFLPRMRKDAARIAPAFSCQIAESIPCLPEDEGVDVVVTERDLYETYMRL